MSAWPGWDKQLLTAGKWKATAANLRFLDEWHAYEGGGAANNPLNTTQPWPGSTLYNSVGVRNYPSHSAGIDATLKTLHNGHYEWILLALKSGDPFKVSYSGDLALDLDTWGSHSFESWYLGQVGSTTTTGGTTTGGGGKATSKQAPWQHGWHAVRHAMGRDMPKSLTTSKHARQAALRVLGYKGKVR